MPSVSQRNRSRPANNIAEAEETPVTDKIMAGLKTAGEILSFVLFTIYCYIKLIVHKVIPPKMKPLNDEIFLITGSSTGIGREVVLRVAKYHPTTILVLWDFNPVENKKTAEDARKLGAKVFTYEVDVSDRKLVEETAKKVQEEVGDVTILFNNAGIAKIGDFFKVPAEDLEKVLQVNLVSHMWTLRAFLPKMMENNYGHIVTTSSMGGYVGARHCVPYFAAKYGIRGMLESLQDELYAHPLQPTNIKFTTVFPLFVATPMTTKVKINQRINSTHDRGFMTAEYTAELIVNGIRRNQEKVFVPPGAELIVLFKSLIPTEAFAKISRALMKDEGTVEYPEYANKKLTN